MNFIEKIFYLPKFLMGYSMGDPNRNGEYRFAKNFIKDGMIIFDVGANVGEYTSYLLSLNSEIIVHCFEPVISTFSALKNNPIIVDNRNKIVLNNLGVGDKEEQREIYIFGEKSGLNSLFVEKKHSNESQNLIKEVIKIITLDNYISDKELNKIDLIKIDVEGADLLVLEGMKNILQYKKVYAIQFEYNVYWKVAGSKLTNAIRYLESFGYNLYRLTPWGNIKVSSKSRKVENFLYSNYLAILKQ
jgi:FkbM family methyltransferase